MSLLKRLQAKGVMTQVGVPAPARSRREVAHLEEKVLSLFYEEMDKLSDHSEESLRRYFTEKAAKLGQGLKASDRAEALEGLLAEVIGLSALEFALPLPEVKHLFLSRDGKVWIEREGSREEAPRHFRDEEHLRRTLEKLFHQIEVALQEGKFTEKGAGENRELSLTIPYSLAFFRERGTMGPSTAAFLEAFSWTEEEEEGTVLDLGKLLFLYRG